MAHHTDQYSNNGLTAAAYAEYLRRLCLFRHDVGILMQRQQPGSPLWYSLNSLRRSLDHNQAVLTGDPHHFATTDDRNMPRLEAAND